MPVSRLTAFQRDVLATFARREYRFFLTGGGALAGFYFGHRMTDDLDFVTLEDGALEDGARALTEAARELGASATWLSDHVASKRLQLRRGDEELKIDLIFEHSPQAFPKKSNFDGIPVDSLGEILVNKLCALSRLAVRDLVDIWALERAGHRVEDAIPLAMEKEGGITPGRLADAVRALRVDAEAPVPPGASLEKLEAYRRALIDRLARMAFPGPR